MSFGVIFNNSSLDFCSRWTIINDMQWQRSSWFRMYSLENNSQPTSLDLNNTKETSLQYRQLFIVIRNYFHANIYC